MKLRRPWPDVLGIAFTVVAVFVVLAPALRPGFSLGPFDLLGRFGLTYHPGAHVHNAVQADQIEQFVPWTYLAWHLVHSGQLPLWNPYNVLGVPLAFNWQSGVFSLPVALGYLFPVHLAYTVTVLTKLVVAGTGAYFLCRVIRLRPSAAAFGGTVFELSGPIVVHAGWSMTGVTVWTGWILALVIMIVRSSRPLKYALVLGVVSALTIYGGHPESMVIVSLCTLVFAAVYVITGGGPVLGSLVGRLGLLALAVALAVALGGPLLFPGLQLGIASTRGAGIGASAISITRVPNLIAAGLQGVDFRSAAYVGVIATVLALCGARAGWRRPEVRALLAVVGVTVLLTYVGPFDELLHHVPGARAVDWGRAVMVLSLALAVLAAVGFDALIAERGRAIDRVLVRWANWALAACGLVLVVLALCGLVGLSAELKANLYRLIAPAAELAVGFLVFTAPVSTRIGPALRARAMRLGGQARWFLLVTATVVLLVAGVGFWSVRQGYFPSNSGTSALQAQAGSALVGMGTCAHLGYMSSTKQVGIRADANIAYGVQEFSVYDPILPISYFRLWRAVSGMRVPQSQSQFGSFCAPITNLREARLFGIHFVLEPPGRAAPPGMTRAAQIGQETLYRVPGASRATLSAVPPSGSLSLYAPGSPVPVDQPQAGTWRIATEAQSVTELRLRLTAVPGWRATIDGHSLALRTWADGTMLEASLPAGRHVVVVHYWPRAFSLGLVLGVFGLADLVVLSVVAIVFSRTPSGALGRERR